MIRLHDKITKRLHSKGSVGMSTILKACLSIFNRKDGAHTEMAKFFEAIFPGTRSSLRRRRYDFFNMANLSYLGIGSAEWHSCKIEAPSADLVFAGANLFENYWISAAHGTIFKSGRASHDTIKFLERAVQESPNDVVAIRFLGFVALEADEYNVAATAFERIVELGHLNDPKAVRFLDNIERCLAEVYKMRGDHDRVIALYLKRAEEDSTDTRCLRLLGTAYMRAGRHEEAIRVLQVATSLDGVGIGLLGNAL